MVSIQPHRLNTAESCDLHFHQSGSITSNAHLSFGPSLDWTSIVELKADGCQEVVEFSLKIGSSPSSPLPFGSSTLNTLDCVAKSNLTYKSSNKSCLVSFMPPDLIAAINQELIKG